MAPRPVPPDQIKPLSTRIGIEEGRGSAAGRRSRRRGAKGELEVVEIVRAHGWPARRNFGSGSRGGGDIIGPPGTHIEVKLTERLKLRVAWAQATEDARDTDLVIVAHRCNRQPWLATVELDELLALLQLRES